DATAGNVIGGKAGNLVALEDELHVLFGKGDNLVGGGNGRHTREHKGFGVGTSNLHSPCHNIALLLGIMEVKLPIGEGSLEGTLHSEKFVFAHRLRCWATQCEGFV